MLGHDAVPPTANQGCAAGTYKPAYGNQIGLCLSCPAGFYSEGVGATSQSECEACPLGSYGESPGLSSATGCAECPAGTYGSAQGEGAFNELQRGGGGRVGIPCKTRRRGELGEKDAFILGLMGTHLSRLISNAYRTRADSISRG